MAAPQGTDGWRQDRLGKLTASRMADATARIKTGWGASRATLMGELIAERLTGAPGDRFTSDAMRWGTEYEPEARAAYCFIKDVDVAETGFVDHPEIAMSGASPDGLIGATGLIEIKCPNTMTHIETLKGREAPSKYIIQMQWQMACTGREWCDFVSYDPRLPEDMRIFIKRVERDDEHIDKLAKMAREFLAELDETLKTLRESCKRNAA